MDDDSEVEDAVGAAIDAMSRVNVDIQALTDTRFVLVGRRLGETHYSILGRMIYVWNECLQRGTTDLSAAEVDIAGGREGLCDALLQEGLARRVVRDSRSLIYVSGTTGRVEWLKQMRALSSKGSIARTNNAQKKKLEKGLRGHGPVRVDLYGSTPPTPDPAPITKTPESGSTPGDLRSVCVGVSNGHSSRAESEQRPGRAGDPEAAYIPLAPDPDEPDLPPELPVAPRRAYGRGSYGSKASTGLPGPDSGSITPVRRCTKCGKKADGSSGPVQIDGGKEYHLSCLYPIIKELS